MMKKLLGKISPLILVAICAVIVVGTSIERQSLLKKRLDPYTIEVYRYGITLNNSNQLFYNISPYNASPLEFENGQKTPYKQFYTLLNFFNLGNPKATFVGNNPIVINTKVDGKEIEIEYQSDVKSISFNSSDMIFNDKYEVFTDISELGIEESNRYYGAQFIKAANDIVTGNSIIIANPYMGGAIIVDLTRFDSITVRNQEKLIEFASNNKNSELKLKIYNSLQGVINDIK